MIRQERFEVYHSDGWRARLVRDFLGRKILARTTEAYENKEDLIEAINDFGGPVSFDMLEDMSAHDLEFRETSDGRWYWVWTHDNGHDRWRSVGYHETRLSAKMDALSSFISAASTANPVEVTE